MTYAIKMGFKVFASNDAAAKERHVFSVYPLEGVWKQKKERRTGKGRTGIHHYDTSAGFYHPKYGGRGIGNREKNPNPLYGEIRFDTMQDGKCIEILHIGAFDDEPASFKKMARLAKKNGLKRDESCHREIYLNNANRAEKSKLKTILSFSVK